MVSSSTISATYNLNLADGASTKYSMVAARNSQSPSTAILAEEATHKTHLETNQIQRKTSLIASKSDERCGSTVVEFHHSEIDQSNNIDVGALCPFDNVFPLTGAAQDTSWQPRS
ncbi:hypothetical protein ACH5RR_026181 [Cinchona calisaya]|uniref:Uncharacterized protein n=1 Tax=Cinchona calisaya TaxID=153742 RepID=A0ABD2Z1T2_9GENT